MKKLQHRYFFNTRNSVYTNYDLLTVGGILLNCIKAIYASTKDQSPMFIEWLEIQRAQVIIAGLIFRLYSAELFASAIQYTIAPT